MVVGMYNGTDDIGFPMTGAGGDTGEGGLLVMEGTTFRGL